LLNFSTKINPLFCDADPVDINQVFLGYCQGKTLVTFPEGTGDKLALLTDATATKTQGYKEQMNRFTKVVFSKNQK